MDPGVLAIFLNCIEFLREIPIELLLNQGMMLNTIWQHTNCIMYDVVFTVLFAMMKSKPTPMRRIWMRPRSQDFWERIVLQTFTEQQWIETFRMKRVTFEHLVQSIRHKLEPLPTLLRSRNPISCEKQVAIALYYMASCCEYRVVGDVFGVHKTSVWRCLHRVVDAINEDLLPQWIQMPTEEECQLIANNFEEKCNIPRIIGCIDGSHIPMTPPSDGYRDYVNRKGWTSMVLQGIVDDKCRFRNINIRAPGSCHDAAVFRESRIFQYHVQVIPQRTQLLNGINIPFMIVGDPAYPLLPWLLKGYTKVRRLTPEEDSFNVYLSRARVSIEIGFGRLKARWRCLLKRLEIHHIFVPNIISACCVLHNIVEQMREPFCPRWMDFVQRANQLFPQPEVRGPRQYDNFDGTIIRTTLKDYLIQFPLLQSFHHAA